MNNGTFSVGDDHEIVGPNLEKIIKENYYEVLGFYSYPMLEDADDNTVYSLDLLMIAPTHWSKQDKYSSVMTMNYHQDLLRIYNGRIQDIPKDKRNNW